MLDKKCIFCLLVLCLISFSSQGNNWTIYNNSIEINNYVSSLTEDERENYYYWIGLRNSFYYSEDSNQLEKLVKYFTPEDKKYYMNLFNFCAPGFVCAGLVIVVIIFYLVRRFCFKGCLGPKVITSSYDHVTYFFIITGIIVGVPSLVFTLINASNSK
jgi:hypothetical protein